MTVELKQVNGVAQNHLPPLIFDDRALKDIVRELIIDRETLIVADPFNYTHIPQDGQLILVTNNKYEQIIAVREQYRFSNVIGIGGCVCLDVARMLALGKRVILIPTILSTSCISNDGAVILFPEGSRYVKTEIPEKVIIPIDWMLKVTPQSVIDRWSSSGVGDIISNIGAAIDVSFQRNRFHSLEKVQQLSLTAHDVVNWIESSFTTWNVESLKIMAKYLYCSGLDVILTGNPDLSGGGEHDWYHALMRRRPQFLINGPTHGQIVSLGTVIEAYIFDQALNNQFLFKRLANICDKVGLPRTFGELNELGLTQNLMQSALRTVVKIKPNSVLGMYFSNQKNLAILNDIFA